jgi:hemerythrin-like domain-containing protein
MLNSALVVIQDEHRSLATVAHGLRYAVREIGRGNSVPDFKLLWAMIFYLDAFPEKMHHPKEEAYLFARLRLRTRDADSLVADLEQEHLTSARNVRNLEFALERYAAGMPAGLDEFAAAVEAFSAQTLGHIALEEAMVIPLARKHLTTEDWIEIGSAFSENGDPRFNGEADRECRDLFARIVNLAAPSIGGSAVDT